MGNLELVIGDSHQVFAEALQIVLAQRGFEVLAVAPSLANLRRLVRVKRPRLCLMDRYFGGADAVEVIGELVAASPRTKVVMLSAEGEADGVARALHAGAFGYLHKKHGVTALVSALRRVDAGEIAVDVVAERSRSTSDAAEVRLRAKSLTCRERQCLRLLVEGLGTTEMSRRLGVRSSTLRGHVQGLMTKLGVHSRLEAAALATRHSLLDRPVGGVSPATR
ncbi:MAG TPA: response regulator transcription factor [Amycolatopsis sp.]|uniref:response regulator transcription factor n=1 Tax=Amycolatopsis sp. TaxID=37632 RepID=UPI002B4A8F38|nr:response regulator transcription factor [Amycolatopsis sp.]HKS45257.1 response regulator transcription factor [Amycolatopsis sp.]